MVNFTQNRSAVFYNGVGIPVKWMVQYGALNFNVAGPTAPFPTSPELDMVLSRYRTLIIERIHVTDDAAAAGTTIMPTIVPIDGTIGGFAFGPALQKQIFAYASDTCEWGDLEVPVKITRLTAGDAWMNFAMAGYAATDDLTLWVWGRFE